MVMHSNIFHEFCKLQGTNKRRMAISIPSRKLFAFKGQKISFLHLVVFINLSAVDLDLKFC